MNSVLVSSKYSEFESRSSQAKKNKMIFDVMLISTRLGMIEMTDDVSELTIDMLS